MNVLQPFAASTTQPVTSVPAAAPTRPVAPAPVEPPAIPVPLAKTVLPMARAEGHVGAETSHADADYAPSAPPAAPIGPSSSAQQPVAPVMAALPPTTIPVAAVATNEADRLAVSGVAPGTKDKAYMEGDDDDIDDFIDSELEQMKPGGAAQGALKL